jgi:hypothetical protein
MECVVCEQSMASPFRAVDEIAFYKCAGCGSIFADPEFLAQVEAGQVGNYRENYWAEEMKAATERCYGSSLVRVAETFFYARRPIQKFIDIGAGSGLLLDAASTLLPSLHGMFHGIELFPPPAPNRSLHPNYHIGTLGDLDDAFDAGVCIEVIEHLTPATLRGLARQLASRSAAGALYYFNSGQPIFVERENPGYLDPLKLGHVVSYSIAGLAGIFGPAGFNVIALPGRNWAFLLEYGPVKTVTCADLFNRIWNPVPENMAALAADPFGNLFRTMGQESARSFLEYATAEERTKWAVSLRSSLQATLPVAAKNKLKRGWRLASGIRRWLK